MNRSLPRIAGLAGLAVTVALAGCASAARPPAPAPRGAALLHWSRFTHLPGVVDFSRRRPTAR